MYRSKQRDFMNEIKDSVLSVTRGLDKEDRKFAIDYLRRHVKIDDLHEYAVKKFPNKSIVFGSGSFNATVIVLTKNPIDPQTKAKLDKAWERMNVSPDKVYYAHLRFVLTKKKQDIRQEIVEKLIDIISPRVVLAFDNLSIKVPNDLVAIPYAPSVLTDGDVEERKTITKTLKDVRPVIIN